MRKILVVGSLNIDFTSYVKAPPRLGESVIVRELKEAFGGKGANQACAISKLGGDVTMIGAVGDDAQGQRMLEGLRGMGVKAEGVIAKPGISTGQAFITVADNGNNTIVVYLGANEAVTKEDVSRFTELIAASDYCLLQYEIPMPVVEHTIRLCREHGTQVIVNPAPFRQLSDEVYSLIDVLIPNETELAALAAAFDEEGGENSALDGKNDESDKVVENDRAVNFDEQDKADKTAKNDKTDKGDKNAKDDKDAKTDNSKKTDKTDNHVNPDKHAKTDNPNNTSLSYHPDSPPTPGAPSTPDTTSTPTPGTSARPDLEMYKAQCRQVLSKGVKSVLVTLGELGSLYCSREDELFVPAQKVEAVDTTAAGDTFIGAFLTELARGREVPEAMQFASRAAAITVSRQGAQVSIPTYDEVLKS